MDTDGYYFLDWPEYHLLTQKLAAAIISHTDPFEEIVAISRGGLTLGHLLSDLLRLPISTFAIQSYSDIQTRGEARITLKLPGPITGKRVLLVDDVSDSGTTLRRATEYLKTLDPGRIESVTLFYKPHSEFRPDFYAKQTSKWILFPYEPTEMIILLTGKLEREGVPKRKIQEFLLRLGYREGQIAFARKHHLRPS
jgi:hypothetical protein